MLLCILSLNHGYYETCLSLSYLVIYFATGISRSQHYILQCMCLIIRTSDLEYGLKLNLDYMPSDVIVYTTSFNRLVVFKFFKKKVNELCPY